MPAPKRRGRPRKEESAAKNTSENKKTTAEISHSKENYGKEAVSSC